MKRRNFIKLGLLSIPVMKYATASTTSVDLTSTEATSAVTDGLSETIAQKYRLLVPEIFAPLPTPPQHSQAIIIGSGFGGSITALRLAEQDIQVTMLEQGSRWPRDKWRQIFANDLLADGRGYWYRNIAPIGFTGLNTVIDKFGGVVDVINYPNIDVWRGACVGGGSQVYTGVMIAPTRTNFDMVFEGLLDYDDFTQNHYPVVRNMLNLKPMPLDVYNSINFGHAKVWDTHVIKAGFTSIPNDGVWNWDVVRAEIAGHSRASATIGESNLGNSNGVKFDLNQNYLKLAQESGNLSIYPGHQVQSVAFNGSTYEIRVKKVSPAGTVLSQYTLTCDYLFMAAGSIGTSELMVKAKSTGTLNQLNEYVGKGFGTNGDVSTTRAFSQIKGILQASPSASRIETSDYGLPATLENWYVPGLPPNIGIIASLGMMVDMQNRGEFVYDASQDAVNLLWDATGNDDAIATARAINNKICEATDTLPGVGPIYPDVSGSFTAHPLGGMVIGKATDNYGRVLGYKNLYVVDGSLIPGSTGAVNPSLTISALAERNIQEVITQDILADNI